MKQALFTLVLLTLSAFACAQHPTLKQRMRQLQEQRHVHFVHDAGLRLERSSPEEPSDSLSLEQALARRNTHKKVYADILIEDHLMKVIKKILK